MDSNNTDESKSAEISSDPTVPSSDSHTESKYIIGWRLHVITIALCLSIFLASLEVSIVATSLVSIANSLGSFEKSSWIINAYMLTYTGFLITWAKLSDIFGRKLFILSSVLLFVIFSGACGAAQTSLQLIVFRAFQGLGGAGTYSLTVVIFFELVPPAKFALYTSMVSVVLALALMLGPLLGGAITNGTTWRWVFLINVPFGVLAAILLMVTIPNGFPRHSLSHTISGVTPGDGPKAKLLSKHNFRRVDFIGLVLLLTASIFLVAALEEAARGYQWDSAVVVSFLVISAVSWPAFILWERHITQAAGIQEPIFPWRFLQSRVRVGMILTMILTGGPFTVAVIQIPQRFQAVNGLSSLDAAIRLLPFALASPFGSALAPLISKKAKVPPLYLCLVGSALQLIGFGLLTTTPQTVRLYQGQYGYQFVAGLGVGINLACLVVMAPFTVEERDKSVAMSSMVQFRTLGGAICLAIASSVFNGYIRTRFLDLLPEDMVDAVLSNTQALRLVPPEVKVSLIEIYSVGYNVQFMIAVGFSAAQVPASLLMWQKKQILV